MGLDMYLKAEKFVSGHAHLKDAAFDALKAAVGVAPDKNSPYYTVGVTIGYWRKANAIHGWFVDNVQDRRDECEETPVYREHLEQLRDTCRAVLEKPDSASTALPTRGGCFFGSTEYGDGYKDDLKRTIEIVDRALALPSEWHFSYRASW